MVTSVLNLEIRKINLATSLEASKYQQHVLKVLLENRILAENTDKIINNVFFPLFDNRFMAV